MNALLHPVGEQSPASFRARLEAEIERLISLLDMIDRDPDLEDPSDAEPSLGWVTRWQSGRIVTGSDSDLEAVPVVGGDK